MYNVVIAEVRANQSGSFVRNQEDWKGQCQVKYLYLNMMVRTLHKMEDVGGFSSIRPKNAYKGRYAQIGTIFMAKYSDGNIRFFRVMGIKKLQQQEEQQQQRHESSNSKTISLPEEIMVEAKGWIYLAKLENGEYFTIRASKKRKTVCQAKDFPKKFPKQKRARAHQSSEGGWYVGAGRTTFPVHIR